MSGAASGTSRERADDVVVTGAGVVTSESLAVALDRLPEPVRARAVRAERVTQLALAAATLALRDAGLATDGAAPRAGIGVVLGTAFGCFLTNVEHQRRIVTAGPSAASPRTFAATVSNAATGEIGIAHGLAGPAITVSAGLASGLLALGEAAALLRRGRLDAVVAGGADAWGDALGRWLADAGLADVVPPGEGAALLVLERAAGAAGRGAPVLATVERTGAGFGRGFRCTADGDGGAGAAPDPRVATCDTEPVALPPGLAERAVHALVAGIARVAPGERLVAVERCPTGHAALVVLRREAAA